MTDTLYADISEFQVPVDNRYPFHFLAIRSNDGTYRDQHFTANVAWTKHACDTKVLAGFIVYFVWEPGWQQTIETFKAMVGTPHPLMAVMIDVESWGGRISGDNSAGITAARENLISWLHGNRKRVIGYGSAYDLVNLWRSRGDTHIVLANWSANPAFPNKIAHQFSETYNTAPFGPCDINSADGYTPAGFAAALGLSPGAIVPKPPSVVHGAPKPKPVPPPSTYTVRSGDTLSGIAEAHGTTWETLARINNLSDPNRIYVGQVLKLVALAPAPKPAAKPAAAVYYTVRSGDNLSGIAARYHTSVSRLASLNHIANVNLIYVGQRLRVS